MFHPANCSTTSADLSGQNDSSLSMDCLSLSVERLCSYRWNTSAVYVGVHSVWASFEDSMAGYSTPATIPWLQYPFEYSTSLV